MTLNAGKFRQSALRGSLGVPVVNGGTFDPSVEATRVALSDTNLYFVIRPNSPTAAWGQSCIMSFPFLKSTHNMY